jgi:hypothetical protein
MRNKKEEAGRKELESIWYDVLDIIVREHSKICT